MYLNHSDRSYELRILFSYIPASIFFLSSPDLSDLHKYTLVCVAVVARLNMWVFLFFRADKWLCLFNSLLACIYQYFKDKVAFFFIHSTSVHFNKCLFWCGSHCAVLFTDKMELICLSEIFCPLTFSFCSFLCKNRLLLIFNLLLISTNYLKKRAKRI